MTELINLRLHILLIASLIQTQVKKSQVLKANVFILRHCVK